MSRAKTGSKKIPAGLPSAPKHSSGKSTDRRCSPRVKMALPAALIPLGSTELLHCKTNNVCEGGIHITAPIGFGLGVGQRCEVLLASASGDQPDSAPLTGDGHYATVVRTEMHVGENDNPRNRDCIDVSLHFDQPLVL